MKLSRFLIPIVIAIAVFCIAPAAWAFCGFYVAKADTNLYNQASQVAIARDGNRTVLTMANDYQGDVADFAMVVPVPVVLQEEQVHVGDPKIMERLDSFSAPRLVEYFDADPCQPPPMPTSFPAGGVLRQSANEASARRDAALGVTVESQFTVGEYDIVILSARESDGLETWLRQNNYRIPRGASQLLQPYIRQGMKFFVAKVNLEAFDRSGFQSLRPLQMAYESPRFMLPIRLGMINAKSEQDLIVYLMSPQGQTELTNYRMVNIPSNEEIPVFVKNEFSDFYKDMFQTAYEKEGRNIAFLEYAWNMGGCDPCSADPLNPDELRKSGVFWLPPNGRGNVFITRLHVRYTRDKFPEDLIFQETSNRQFFQGRYILRHPFEGEADCPAGREYKRALPSRFEAEAQTLARLTGWDIDDIRKKLPEVEESEPEPWWRTIWPR
ncbi:MAG: DUF2330 domain-containing protein [Leptolyngbyaceae cyanobacterium MO_188.B28]|nr:DUF2330 domain-containing protein [Leptolyngbyaceae cyanobacterium MO_188.B28]